jgi:two-component system sensor histidine kinase YesM
LNGIKRKYRFVNLGGVCVSNWKLHNKLIFLFIVFITIPLSIVGGVSYINASKLIERNIRMYTLQTLEQASYNLESIINEVDDLSLYIIANKNIRELLKKKNNVSDLQLRASDNFVNLCNSKKYIQAISIIDNHNNIYTYGNQSNKEDILKFLSQLKHQIPDSGNCILTDTYDKRYSYFRNKHVFSYIRQINDINTFEKIGTLVVDIDENFINNIYKYLKLDTNSELFIINRTGKIISSSNKNNLGKSISDKEYFKKLIQNKMGYYKYKEKGEDMIVTAYPFFEDVFVLVHTIPFDQITYEKKEVKKFTVFTFIICICLASVVSIILSESITKPLDNLSKAMMRVEEGEFETQVRIYSNDEVGKLSRVFNRMINIINHLINKVYEVQLKEKEAEIKMLHSQINPHFLYNTLDTIYWLGRMEKANKTSDMIKALSNLFRFNLNRAKEFITIQEELSYIKNYIVIQQTRYEDKIHIELDIDKSMYNYKILPMVLQPLIENAIIHGSEEQENLVLIIVKGYIDEESIIFEVIDNGKGADEVLINKILNGEVESTNIGLKNISDRITLYFGEDFGIKFNSKIGMGTTVQVILPKLESGSYKKENNNDKIISC